MGAEAIVFRVIAPVDVDRFWPLRLWTNSVAPVIIIGKTSSGPAQDGDAQRAQIFDCLLAITIDVWNWGIWPDPKAAVDTGSEVLGKMSVQLGANGADFHVCLHVDTLFELAVGETFPES